MLYGGHEFLSAMGGKADIRKAGRNDFLSVRKILMTCLLIFC
jgi:hypothetical protein